MSTNNLQFVRCKPKCVYYLQALINLAKNKSEQIQNNDRAVIIQTVFYSVKYLTAHQFADKKCRTREEIENLQGVIEYTRIALMQLTPKEFINLFPIKKEYDGEKYMMKDYFSTIDSLKAFDMIVPIGTRLDDLLWDYQNDTIREFLCKMLCVASDLRKIDGKMGIVEEWAADNDIETITVHEKDGYIMNNTTHKTMPYKKPIPDYIKIAE